MENNNETNNNFSDVFTSENGKMGVKLSNGKVVIPALYDAVASATSILISINE